MQNHDHENHILQSYRHNPGLDFQKGVPYFFSPLTSPETRFMNLSRPLFGEDFHWGVSTAAFQTEGAHDADGKGPSIWDVFTQTHGRVKNNHHAQTACDFYNVYKHDLTLAKSLSIPNFRFSVSWPRIMPDGKKPLNQAGLDHYDRLIDQMLETGIEPWLTLYHWDLPHALELKGGWTNRDTVLYFSDYADVCARQFGDRVKNWMVMNEPSVFTGGGYFLGIHAPGRMGISNFLKAMHHATLAQGEGGRRLRAVLPQANIGTTYSCTHIEPFSQNSRDIAAAERVDTLLNRAFIEPILGLGYPEKQLPALKKIQRYQFPGDSEKMAFDFDFIGLQCYTREIVKASYFTPYLGAALVPAAKRKVPITEMGWEVHPPALYNTLKKFSAYANMPPILVTENGAAFPDQLKKDRIHDLKRIKYLQDHLTEILRAKQDGVNVNGYFVWTLTDNFEWSEGYHPRFGLVYVDFETQERIVKDSGRWYRDFLSGASSRNGLLNKIPQEIRHSVP